MRPTTTSIRKWWYAKSDLFTTMCATEPGETFTHGEVVLTNLFIVLLFAVCGLAEKLGGAL